MCWRDKLFLDPFRVPHLKLNWQRKINRKKSCKFIQSKLYTTWETLQGNEDWKKLLGLSVSYTSFDKEWRVMEKHDRKKEYELIRVVN